MRKALLIILGVLLWLYFSWPFVFLGEDRGFIMYIILQLILVASFSLIYLIVHLIRPIWSRFTKALIAVIIMVLVLFNIFSMWAFFGTKSRSNNQPTNQPEPLSQPGGLIR